METSGWHKGRHKVPPFSVVEVQEAEMKDLVFHDASKGEEPAGG